MGLTGSISSIRPVADTAAPFVCLDDERLSLHSVQMKVGRSYEGPGASYRSSESLGRLKRRRKLCNQSEPYDS